jgi:hypothetical protein
MTGPTRPGRRPEMHGHDTQIATVRMAMARGHLLAIASRCRADNGYHAPIDRWGALARRPGVAGSTAAMPSRNTTRRLPSHRARPRAVVDQVGDHVGGLAVGAGVAVGVDVERGRHSSVVDTRA